MDGKILIHASAEFRAGNYEKAIELLNQQVLKVNEETDQIMVIACYQQKAECEYKLQNYSSVMKDIDCAVEHGLVLEKDEHFFLMYQHAMLESALKSIVNNLEKQATINSKSTYYRIAVLVKRIRFSNIFTGNSTRERSQSADRHRR